MHIEWSIKKKRGNLRPVLQYTVRLTDYERRICMGSVRVLSTIPKPPDAGWNHCWPGENERGNWEPAEFYKLMTPPHKIGEFTVDLKLPWREDNRYPEVEDSFVLLRDAFESALTQASGSNPIDEKGSLETSCVTKKAIAPAFAAERFLSVVGK